MPPLVRKILIIAAADGLLLLPSGPKSRTSSQSKIAYKNAAITSVTTTDGPSSIASAAITIEAHGIAGLLTLPSGSWLIAITRRDPVAEIKGRSIFVVTDIALIPLQSKSEAESAMNRYKVRKVGKGIDDEDDANDTDDEDEAAQSNDDEIQDHQPPQSLHKRTSSIAEDVIGKKGVYGRFAEKWFSKRGWQVDQKRTQGLSAMEGIATPRKPSPVPDQQTKTEAVAPVLDEMASKSQGEKLESKDGDIIEVAGTEKITEEEVASVANSLTPKLLRTTKLLLATSKSFYFSYDYDVTRSLSTNKLPSSSGVPLYKLADEEYFWNQHLMAPFINSNQDHLILPLMEGFMGQSHFEVPSKEDVTKNFFLTLISRRSVNRAGLRYLRRGIDEAGNVANCVETEQLLSDADNGSSCSFVQLRGSIPVFFQQSPYGLKPKPVLMHGPEANKAAFKTHFKKLKQKYGAVQAVNLVEKHSQEAIVGDVYQQQATEMEDPKIAFEWFDFHAECKGMKFENVCRLIERTDESIKEYGWTEETDDKIIRQQNGVLRTNCMDCLDRTNVVQSAYGRKVLEDQLMSMNFDIAKIEESTTFMNMIWAENGDKVSLQYSSTAALKGDFTRTKKRNISGALTDFGLTITRYWNNIIGDFFTQAAIDFLLGNVSAQVFAEFETNMMSGDPAISMRKVRQNAIETSVKIVVEDGKEELVAGWVLLAPAEDNTIKTQPFQETVLLLTDLAIYFCRFDYTMEKVLSFERIHLSKIQRIQHGTYITSTLSPSSTNPKQNVGILINYIPGKEDQLKINTRSMTSTFSRQPSTNQITPVRSLGSDTSRAQNVSDEPEKGIAEADEKRILAFKALPADIATSHHEVGAAGQTGESEQAQVFNICHEIERVCKSGGFIKNVRTTSISRSNKVFDILESSDETAATQNTDKQKDGFIIQEDIIDLQQAKKSTGLLEQVGYSIRRLVWA